MEVCEVLTMSLTLREHPLNSDQQHHVRRAKITEKAGDALMSGDTSPSRTGGAPSLSGSAAAGLTYVVLHLRVVPVHQLQQPQLDLGLVQEGLFVLDDLDGHQLLGLVIIGFHHLPERGTSQSGGRRRSGTEPGATLLPPAKVTPQYH